MKSHYLVRQGKKVNLNEWDPRDSTICSEKEEGRKQFEKLNRKLEELQEIIYAEHKHKILVVLQAMDTGGKDGTIRKVFERVNPQGVRVANFKVPTSIELDHDYLWRVHKHTPGRGEIAIFNRSHYEDVLVVRIHELVPQKVWNKRYRHINDFERLLADEGTTIIKLYLHIDLDEQKKRFIARIDDPTKHWKFNPGDLDERKRWKDYIQAYEDVLSKTSTSWAPWYIIPANRKWYRDLVIANILVDTLEKLKPQYPASVDNIDQYKEILVNEP